METLTEKYRNLQFSSLGTIRSHTCMLLTGSTIYKVHGTGVFIQIKEHYFLISAAHVLDKFGELFVFLSEDYEIIKPGGIVYNHRAANRDKDTLDIGVLKLDNQCVPHILRAYNFLKADDLAINHIFQNEEFYTFLGYPETRSKIVFKTDIFKATTFFHFTAPEKSEYYLKLDRNPAVNVVTSYNKKNAYDSRNGTYGNGPALHGISGCGLWFTDPSDLSTGIIKPKLTAIMTDWPIKNRTIIIGTRIDIITEIIRKYFDIDFPESRIVRLN